MNIREDIRNVAIVAHVDHGKTTLVDCLLKQSGVFRENQQVAERIMDSNSLERERGITILAKNTSIFYNGVKINIVDTPGHADFGGEVERTLKMVDNILLVVDAFEGPMPQTKFVLKKALDLNLKPIVVVNKVDRPGARPLEVVDEVLDLFISLDADEDQLEFPVIYCSAVEGWASLDPHKKGTDLKPLFDLLIDIVNPPQGEESPLQLMVTSIEYNEFVGRIAVGKLVNGILKPGQAVTVCSPNCNTQQKIGKIYTYQGLNKVEVQEARFGDIYAISGLQPINIGETVADLENPQPLPFIKIDEPTISMTFSVNNSPFAGLEGKFVTSRHLRERLLKELETNVSLRVEETDQTDSFEVKGRGELHLSILIETMRREGYEFQVSKPQVIFKEIDGVKHEPIEKVTIDVPQEFSGTVIEKLGRRKGVMLDMVNLSPEQVRLEFLVPARGLIGYRSELLTDTKGNGIISHIFEGYEPYKGEISYRTRGSLVASETGESTPYGLYQAQARGRLFIPPQTKVYAGMVVGENAKANDIDVNVCKKKQLTNIRASGSDDAIQLTPYTQLSLEQALEFIAEDELVEVTPKSIRLRKKQLDAKLRLREWKARQEASEK
ncbi:translational GTPase TypA [Anaerobranca gottschalkii]|uniref:Large ribosomal subunit assembly factor BipA n=1 Tax=Anaerobranca gottschalkii DSM 13577 TaxID=1120990 RepID=A0A1I0BQN5_9FIRM|nr:translational GTPase TypA [Anaerobranca gottschalkii]SET08635.1 GTP-binding protein [Anaerobranca gottschalkii DSM 13577]